MKKLLPSVEGRGGPIGDWIAAVTRFRKRVPSWVRIGFKIALARLPVPYRMWKKLRRNMNQPDWTVDTFLCFDLVLRRKG